MIKARPSQLAKQIGLSSLNEVSNITGVSIQTLNNWSKNKPKLFAAVCIGCKVIKDSNR